ncbi:site-specific integrase [Shinella sp. DD12]|uniref:tyrosine-type recombinase/integrase n=1 Tax=Shinella sp. DD12 TaxID=1410620 RepID=UPI000437A27B|nr:site-specific integrase [Shinella sp. DD12]EYR84230.1 integrase family protein [Shinella sp. DD12]
MARAINILNEVKIKNAKKVGRTSDGGGLYLNVSKTGTKSWLFMWARDGKRREMGLGPYPAIGLASAREAATRCRTIVAQGGDPLADRSKEEEPTFERCVTLFIESMGPAWRNEKHHAQWEMTLGPAYCKDLQAMKVSHIGADHVLKVLSPVWTTKAETASRLRGRIERVLDFAKVRGWRTGENPAAWRGNLKSLLPSPKKLSRGHHTAMPYADLPDFLIKVRKAKALAARALELLILCASRSGEVLFAEWDEFDLEAKLWVVPAVRMKMGKEHRVPLSARAVAILKELHQERRGNYVFPGQKAEKPLSNMSMAMFMRRVGMEEFTIHGFRSSFRDWCGDETSFPRDIAEMALAHKIGDATEQAYRRADALEKRRRLMEAWAKYLEPKTSGNVVKLKGAKNG